MVGITIDISGDIASRVDALFQAIFATKDVVEVMGREGRNVVRENFFALDGARANRMEGPRSHYYERAGRATSMSVAGDVVRISVSQPGIALHRFGGTVRPVNSKFLTIPASPASYNRRAKEFNDLAVGFGASGPRFLYRRTAKGAPKSRRRVLGAKPQRRRSRDKRGRGRKLKLDANKIPREAIMYWLVKSATFRADPSILPGKDELARRMVERGEKYVARIWSRRNG